MQPKWGAFYLSIAERFLPNRPENLAELAAHTGAAAGVPGQWILLYEPAVPMPDLTGLARPRPMLQRPLSQLRLTGLS
jgi:hypothetical protein